MQKQQAKCSGVIILFHILVEKFLCKRKVKNNEKYLVDYYETYSKSYEIEANNKEEAEDILRYKIQEGGLDGPYNYNNSWCEVSEME